MIQTDASENKKNLGANAILAVSMASWRESCISFTTNTFISIYQQNFMN